MNLSKKQLRDITRTALGFTGVLCAAAALIWLGNRNDAVTNAESLKAGILTLKSSKAPTNYFTPNILRKSWSRLVVSVVHLDALAFPVAAT